MTQMYHKQGDSTNLHRWDTGAGLLAVITKSRGIPWTLVFGVACPESNKAWGRVDVWIESRLSLQSRTHLDVLLLIRAVVVGLDWYGRTQRQYGSGPQQLRNLCSIPWNVAVQVHQLSGHRSQSSFYTTEADQQLTLWLPQITGFIRTSHKPSKDKFANYVSLSSRDRNEFTAQLNSSGPLTSIQIGRNDVWLLVLLRGPEAGTSAMVICAGCPLPGYHSV